MAFYQEMQDMVKDLLKPDTQGGLGQVAVVLYRVTPGVVDPSKPEVEVKPTLEQETLRAAVQSATEYADGSVVLATDTLVVAAVPKLDWRMPTGSSRAVMYLTLDGRKATVVRVRGLPDVGTPAAVQFFLRM